MSKWTDIPIGGYFKASGATYIKIDDLSYESPDDRGMEIFVSPQFEATINEEPRKATGDENPKYITDPATRFMKLNPNYKPPTASAADAFGEMWGSGAFDCGPEDYIWMANEAIAAVRAMKELGELITDGNLSSSIYPVVVNTFSELYHESLAMPVKDFIAQLKQSEAKHEALLEAFNKQQGASQPRKVAKKTVAKKSTEKEG
jgi:hypothetical protein